MRLDSIPGVGFSSWILVLAIILSANAIPVEVQATDKPYAPYISSCPKDVPLTRPANSISEDEASYATKRKAKASVALAAWLNKIDPRLPTSNLPAVALTTSGGGYRSLLTGAGILRAFDGREDKRLPTSSLLQSLTYSSSLSGGAWLTASVGGNGFPKISALQDGLWKTTFQSPLWIPFENGTLFRSSTLQIYDKIMDDINSKAQAGFEATITDLWGRLLS